MYCILLSLYEVVIFCDMIESSNLCTEIIGYSAPDETAVCNLASLAPPSFVVNGVNGKYDFKNDTVSPRS